MRLCALRRSLRRFMQLNPARGRKHDKDLWGPEDVYSWFMQLNPARGRKPGSAYPTPARYPLRFMQLNPARGRKPGVKLTNERYWAPVYAAQPREGTETRTVSSHSWRHNKNGLCSSTPRGDGNTRYIQDLPLGNGSGLCSSTPRGDGNLLCQVRRTIPLSRLGLCSSTPRGDGNRSDPGLASGRTFLGLCSSTPRGDGNFNSSQLTSSSLLPGLCSSTPRGDGNQPL